MAADQAERRVTLPALTDEQARGNRLAATHASPGWNDVCKIIRDLEAEAADANISFEGWDTEQIVILKARAQAAKELRQEFFARIQSAILQATPVTGTPAAASTQDVAPRAVLTFDTRIPGTYEKTGV